MISGISSYGHPRAPEIHERIFEKTIAVHGTRLHADRPFPLDALVDDRFHDAVFLEDCCIVPGRIFWIRVAIDVHNEVSVCRHGLHYNDPWDFK